jgi:putative inorganic carbon (HCO3(-)) transporter
VAAPAAAVIPPSVAVERLDVSREAFDSVRLSICLLLLMTISRIHQHFGFLRPLRPALLLAGLAVFAALANRHALRADHLWKTTPPKLIAGIGIMACVSTVFGISLGGSATFVLYEFSKVLILAFLLILAIRNARDLLVFIWAYVIAAGVLAWLSIFVFRMSKGSNDGLQRILSGYTYDANDIGLVVLIGLALSLLTYHVSRKSGRIVSAIVMIGIGITLAKTGSRGAFIGAIATGLAILFIVRAVSVPRRVMYIVVPALALIVASPPGYWDQMQTILSPKKDYNWTSPTGRRELWKHGLAYMWAYPLTGIGVDNFPRAEGTISVRAVNWDPTKPGIKWSAPHNSFLEAAAEMGIPGIILFVSLLGTTIAIPIRLRRKIPRGWARGNPEQRFLYLATQYLPVAGIGFAFTAFFVSFAYLDPIYVLGAFAAGLSTCVADRLAREAAPAVEGRAIADNRPSVTPLQPGTPEWRSGRLVGGLRHAR